MKIQFIFILQLLLPNLLHCEDQIIKDEQDLIGNNETVEEPIKTQKLTKEERLILKQNYLEEKLKLVNNLYVQKNYIQCNNEIEEIINHKYFDKSKKTNFLKGQILTTLAKLYFYGFSDEKLPNIFYSFLLFKTSAMLGDPESYFYLSLIHFYKLDGTYTMEKNLRDYYVKHKNSKNKLFRKNFVITRHYLQKRGDRLSLLNAYFSSIQDFELSKIVMARKYLQGIGGVEKNCGKSILYFKDIAHKVATESFELIKYVERVYLQKEIFNMNQNAFKNLKLKKATLDEKLLFKSIKQSDGKKYTSSDLFRYLNGKYDSTFDIEEFLTYAFTLDKDEQKSVASIVGYILYRGIRVPQNHKLAYNMFKTAADYKEAKGFNGLGLMYLNGDHVQKDISKAFFQFKRAANLGDSDAQFNLGSMLIYNENNDIPTDVESGFRYITLASQQGHLGALYALALSYIEGSDMYSTCDTAARLFAAVSERGAWNSQLKEALELYNDNFYSHSLMHYLVAAFLGYDVGIINAAILSEKYLLIDEINLKKDYKMIKENNISTILQEKGLLDQSVNKTRNLLYGDIISYLNKSNMPRSQVKILKHILFDYDANIEDKDFPVENTSKNKTNNENKATNIEFDQNLFDKNLDFKFKNFSLYLAKFLYSEGQVDHNTFSGMRLGDLYFYGKLSDDEVPDYETALHYYEKATQTNTSRDTIAQSYHSLGYMYQFGLGTEKNVTKAIDLYIKAVGQKSRLERVYFASKLLAQQELYLKIEISEFIQLRSFTKVMNILGSLLYETLKRTFIFEPLTWLTLLAYTIFVYREWLREKVKGLKSQNN